MRGKAGKALKIDGTLLRAGMRLGVGVSGGADSVALLRALAEQSGELGLVVHAAHLHHGLRGDEADGDLEFVRGLAAELGVEFHEARVDAAAEAERAGETVEEAARRLRYGWFRTLMTETPLDAVATAHTLDDQAETVAAKFLRGAWTEGLAGVHPVVEWPEGQIVRPMLAVRRGEVESYLKELGQAWREDSSNGHLTYTRNRIRHELLPMLEGWNPRLREHMAQMAELAREEESWWKAETARVAGQLILPGLPVRGGGRAGGEVVALDVIRLAGLPVAMQRRLLRHAAAGLGAAPDFVATEALRSLALRGRAGQKMELAQGLNAERTQRELRLTGAGAGVTGLSSGATPLEVTFSIPGEVEVESLGLRLRVADGEGRAAGARATLRGWKPGDRVRLRYSSGEKKVKEVLERMKVTGSARAGWMVLEAAGRVVWMQGVEVEAEGGIRVLVMAAAGPGKKSTPCAD